MPYKDVEKRVAYQKEYQQKYREEHREKLNKAKREKFLCDCGGSYTRNNRLVHEKTMMHQDWLLYELEELRRFMEEES